MSLFKKYNIAELTGEQTALSSDMINQIDLWNDILQGRAFWNKENRPSGIVDCTIGELAKPVAEEIEISAKSEPLQVVMNRLNESSHELVQNMVAVGGSVVRPIYTNNKMQFEIVRLGSYIPTSYDLDGTLTGCVIAKQFKENGSDYLLLEKHKYTGKNHNITLELYEVKGEALKKVPLTNCSSTASLTPSYTWTNVEKPFIVEIRNRMPNKIDGSNVPCALWQGTENLIQNADEQYCRMNWEQEAGEMRVFADEDLFKTKQGSERTEVRYPARLNKLFIKINGNGIDAQKIQEHAPALRTQQQIEAFNQILRRCELAWNIGKGTLSDLETAVQTATQYTGGKKALYSMVDSIESELEFKYKHLAYIFAYMLSVYEEIPFDDEIEISYNDTSRKDPVALKQMAMQEIQNGIMSPAEYRETFFGEDPETAAARVPPKTASDDFGGFSLE